MLVVIMVAIPVMVFVPVAAAPHLVELVAPFVGLPAVFAMSLDRIVQFVFRPVDIPLASLMPFVFLPVVGVHGYR